jgi:predicted PurR-regulated permease PerM
MIKLPTKLSIFVPKPNSMENKTTERYSLFGIPLVRLIMIALSLLVIFGVMWYFSAIVSYILIAWVISLLGEPVKVFLLRKLYWNKLKFGNGLAAVATLLVIVSGIVLLGTIFIPPILKQANNLANISPNAMIKSLEEPIQNFHQFLLEYNLVEPEITPDEIGRQLLKDHVNFNQFGTFLGNLIASTGNIAIAILSSFFIAFFFLKEDKLFRNLMLSLVPTDKEEGMNNAISQMSNLLRRYFGGMFINITIFSLLAYLGLSLIKVPNAALLGFFGGLTNTIPYIGPFIGAIFGIIMTLTSNVEMSFYSELLPLLIQVALVFWGCQLVDNFVLQPLVYGTSVKAHPLEIFIIVLVGAKVGGILGMFLAIPVYTVLRVMAMTFFSEFKLVQKITNSIKGKDT